MKLDYNFMKEILIVMEEYASHEIENLKLLDLLNITNENEDKFIGHIKILGDNNFIECNNTAYPYGIFTDNRLNGYKIISAKYRLTAQGYEFLDVLKKDNIFHQIADLAVPTAFKVGTQILTQTIWEKIKNGI